MLTDEMRADGWIEHDGKGCPVPANSKPAVMFRDLDQRPANVTRAGNYIWRHSDLYCDIVAYRPEKPHD